VYTLKVIGGGLLLLGLCFLVGRTAGLKLFLPLWLVAAGTNI
jgi:hypothetical protein